ncbi:hypothetical protein OpiT1DRAFT_04321 [Opitutaceae bacterium TAV1]|nr:hypothetical protein OpiT1DRAFT_04321 [Opitutaceae bacterium TAV1]
MKHKNNYRPLITAGLLSLLGLAATAYAAEPPAPFSDNFDTLTNWKAGGGTSQVTVSSETDTGALFGNGVGNHYMKINFTGTGAQYYTSQSGFGPITEVSFDFYMPEPTPSQTGYLTLRIGTGTSNGGTAFALALGPGDLRTTGGSGVGVSNTSVATYTHSTLNTVSAVFNNSASDILYQKNGTTYSLQSGKMDLWFGSSLVASAISSNNALIGQDLKTFNFVAKSAGTTPVFYLDNFTVANVTPVPEPAKSGALVGAGILAFAAAAAQARRVRRISQ